MAEDKFKLTGGEQFDRMAAEFEPIVKEELFTALQDTLKEGKKIVQSSIKDANAVASGTLFRSVTALIDSLSSYSWNAIGEIGFAPPADEYAEAADQGQGPGAKSREPDFVKRIIAWVAVKGIDRDLAYPIARSINIHGTNVGGWSQYGRTPFLRNATIGVDAEAKRQFEKVADRIQKRLDANANNNSTST